MSRFAGAVHFARCDAREPDLRPLGAPDGAVTIPDTNWSAGECEARRDSS
jgi:hypothetical protein